LIQLALPQLTGALPPFQLPTGADLGGFELTILGVRGVEGAAADTYPNLAIYADLGFDPTLVPPLSLAADTSARIQRVELPAKEELAISAAGGPKYPTVELELGGAAPEGMTLEYQVRVDGSLWTPFFRPANGIYVMKRPELLVQGRHHVEVRARVQGEYRTLDPSPVRLEVVIDAEPPRIDAEMAARDGGIIVRAFDVVSGDRIQLEVGVNGKYRSIAPELDGFVDLPEVLDAASGISVRATDEQGLTNEVILRTSLELTASNPSLEAKSEDHGGCVCIARAGDASILSLLLLPLGVAGLFVRSRRRAR
jgi:hypothetical protein